MYAKDIMAKYSAPLHASMPHISYARKMRKNMPHICAYEAYIPHICVAYFAKFHVFSRIFSAINQHPYITSS